MRIKRTDSEDSADTDELIAQAMTEDIAKWLQDWLGRPVDSPVGLNEKGCIYNVIRERQKKGVEI